MKVIETDLPEFKIIEPKIFKDDRGYYFETFRDMIYEEIGINSKFVQNKVTLRLNDSIAIF